MQLKCLKKKELNIGWQERKKRGNGKRGESTCEWHKTLRDWSWSRSQVLLKKRHGKRVGSDYAFTILPLIIVIVFSHTQLALNIMLYYQWDILVWPSSCHVRSFRLSALNCFGFFSLLFCSNSCFSHPTFEYIDWTGFYGF